MSGGEDFFDTNVVLYLLSADTAKADRAEELLALGGTISVQVLNEFVAVASRKLRMPLSEIQGRATFPRSACTYQTHLFPSPSLIAPEGSLTDRYFLTRH